MHSRQVETELFDYSDEIKMVLELFSAATRPLMNKLRSANAYWSADPEKITVFGLKMALDNWKRSEVGRSASFGLKGKKSCML